MYLYVFIFSSDGNTYLLKYQNFDNGPKFGPQDRKTINFFISQCSKELKVFPQLCLGDGLESRELNEYCGLYV